MTRHNTARLAPPSLTLAFSHLLSRTLLPVFISFCSKSILRPSQPKSRVGLSIFLQILVVRKRASISTRPTTAAAAPPTAGNQGRQIVATCHLHAAHHTQGTPMHWTHGLALLARAGEPCIPSLSLPGRLHALDRHSRQTRACLVSVYLPACLTTSRLGFIVPGGCLGRSDGLDRIMMADCPQIGTNCQETTGRITKDAVF